MYLRCFCCLLCIEILVLSLSVFAVFKYSESCLPEEIDFDRTQKLLICVVSNHGALVRGGPLKISSVCGHRCAVCQCLQAAEKGCVGVFGY